jgi:hypothetical protein
MGSLFAILALYGWAPLGLLAFALLPARRAVIFTYVAGWLFLPVYPIIKFQGLPDLTKITASSFGVLLGILLFDSRSLLSFRPKWYDLPMLLWCVSPFATSMHNDLGDWDGFSNIVQQAGVWGIPYLVGRIYFKDLNSFRELAIGIILGAVVYTPLIWFEVFFSPQLHKFFYGRHASSFEHNLRWGGYRPCVFMLTGLAVAMYMTTACLAAVWLYVSGALRTWRGIPMMPVIAALLVTSIFCKTMAATAFLMVGLASLFWIKWAKNGLPLLLLVAIPPTYMYLRASEVLPAERIVEIFSHFTNPERLRSLEVRLQAEDIVTERALEETYTSSGTQHNPWLGWGKWDPADPRKTPWRVYLEWEKKGDDGVTRTIVRDRGPTDGLWIITLGQFGILGVIFLTTSILMPALILWRRIPLRQWAHPAVAPVASMAILLLLHMSDNLLNGMINPIFMLCLGGISAIAPAVRAVQQRYGPDAAGVVLSQAGAAVGTLPPGRQGFNPLMPGGPFGMPGYGLNAQAYGQAAQGYPSGVPGYGAGAPTNGPQAGLMAGFPVIPGLQAGQVPFNPQPNPRRRR